MRFLIQNRLIQVGDAPALRDVVVEKCGQFLFGIRGDGVAPSPERHQQFIFLIEGHVAVHHRAETDRADCGQGDAVFLLDFAHQFCVTRLKAFPNLIQRIGPNTVHQLVFPFVAAGCDRSEAGVDQHRFDAGGSKFDSDARLARFDVSDYRL